MITFNDSGIYVGQIKEMLSSFWLPTCKVSPARHSLKDGDHFIEGRRFCVWKDGKAVALSPYKAGDFLPNFSKRLAIRSNYYDSYTHSYLGDYLRYVRDYLGVDLMQMYNCFSWDIPRNVSSLGVSLRGGRRTEFSSSDPACVLCMFPARFGKKYTIAVDWHGTIELCACIYDSNTIVDEDKAGSLASRTYARFSGMSFRSPVIYEGLSNMTGDDSRLKLFVKVPVGCRSSIVVLEGDFRDSAKTYNDGISMRKSRTAIAFDAGALGNRAEGDSVVYSSKSQLLSVNDGGRNLLADRLVEYLSGNVVSPLDEVVRNIEKLHRKMVVEGKYPRLDFGYPGVWSDSYRKAMWQFANDSGIIDSSYDVLGYMDKDVERAMGGLKAQGEED